jgi:drug/metabolite transporter (DMT)-like permease
MHPFLKSAVMLTVTLPFVYLLFPPQTYLQHASWPLAFWGLLLGTLGQVIPTITMNIGIPRIGSSLAALLGSMELPVAVVAAFFIVKEPVGSVQWLGMLLILSGIVTAEMQPFARKKRMERN